MLSAEAYSFHQKSRLAISLSWVAGYTNVVALFVTGHVISHATGSVTFFGSAAGEMQLMPALFFGYMVLAFLGGAVASAVMTEPARRRGLPSKYILPMAVEILLLLIFAACMRQWPGKVVDPFGLQMYVMTGVASFAMGLQNATITPISGAVVRTTHLTGVVTDLGLEGVQLLWWYCDKLRSRRANRMGRVLLITQRHPTFLRVLLLASIFGSFLFGVVAGTLCYVHLPAISLFPPVAFLFWIIFVDWRHPIADVRELDVLSDPELKMYGIVKNLLPSELGLYRLSLKDGSTSHRMPNFEHWVDRLPERWQVVILALSPLARFDSNSAINLSNAIRKLHEDDRKLVIAGVTPAQFRVLLDEGVVNQLEPENLCPDIEFAIARAIEVGRELQKRQPAERRA